MKHNRNFKQNRILRVDLINGQIHNLRFCDYYKAMNLIYFHSFSFRLSLNQIAHNGFLPA